MSAEDDILRFYVQGEDRLSAKLDKVYENYTKLTRQIEKANKKMYNVVTDGLDKIAEYTESIENLPLAATAAIDKVSKRLAKPIKPVVVDVVFKGRTSKIAASIRDVIEGTLQSMSLRLSPTMPEERNSLFRSTGGLKKEYRDQVQPPDLVGFFRKLPTFAQGGFVPGPNLPPTLRSGKDGTLAILSAGELVLPAEIAKEIGKLQGAAGGFIKNDNVANIVAGIENAIKAADKYRNLAESGLDPSAAKKYTIAIQDLDAAQKALVNETKNVHVTMKDKFIPSIMSARRTVADYEEGLRDLAKVNDSLLGKISTDVRYLAVVDALGRIRESMVGVRDGTAGVLNELGAGPEVLGSFIDNLNGVNTTLSLSRSGLNRFKMDASSAAVAADVSLDRMGASIQAAVETGARTQEEVLRVATLIATRTSATGEATDAVAKDLYHQSSQLGMNIDQMSALAVAQKKLVANNAVTLSDITQSTATFTEKAGTQLKNMTTTQRMTVQQANSAMVATLSDNFIGFGQELSEKLGAALSDPTGEAATELGKIGISFQSVQRAVQQGDFGGVIGDMQRFSTTLKDSGQAATLFTNALGTIVTENDSVALQRATNLTGDYAANLKLATVNANGAAATLDELASRNRTWFESLRNTASATVAAFGGTYVMDFFKEFNPQSAVATIYMSKMAIESLGLGKAMGWMKAGGLAILSKFFGSGKGGGPGAGGLVGGVTTLSTVATTGGGAAGGGIAGFLKGLGQGIAGLLTPLANPMALVGLAAVVGGVIGIGYGLKLAAPFVKEVVPYLIAGVDAISTIATTGIEQVFGFLNNFISLPASDILSVSAALLGIGPAFGLIGTGAVVMAAGLGVALPPLMLMSKVFGNSKSGKSAVAGIGDFVSGIVDGLNIDTSSVQKAAATMSAAATLVVSLAAAMGAIQAVRLGGIAVNFSDGVSSVFGLDTRSTIVDTITRLNDTVSDVAQASKGLTTGNVDTVVSAYKAASDIVLAASPLYKAVATLGNDASGVGRSWFDFFTLGNSPLDAIDAFSGRVKGLPERIANDFSNVPDLSKGLDGLTRSSALISAASPLYAAIKDVGTTAGGVDRGWMDWVTGNDGPLVALSKSAPQIAGAVAQVNTSFSRLGGGDFSANVGATTNTLKYAGDMMGAYGGLLTNIVKVGELAPQAITASKAMATAGTTTGNAMMTLADTVLMSPDTEKLVKVEIIPNKVDNEQLAELRNMVALLTKLAEGNAAPVPTQVAAAKPTGRSVGAVVNKQGNGGIL